MCCSHIHFKQYLSIFPFKDCHTVGHVSPVVDQSQDIQLLHGEENNFGTIIKFVRKLDTCDDDDIKITVSTDLSRYNNVSPKHELMHYDIVY